MATFYCSDNDSKWKSIDDTVDLELFARAKLEEDAGLDSDNGYYIYYEFWRDGTRTYALAEYDAWSSRYNLYGDMNTFAYGSLEDVRACDTWHAKHVEANKFSPVRDYIKIKS